MRILVAVIGSLGDLNPRLAIAHGLRRRGHTVTVAAQVDHEQAVRAADLPFRELRPPLAKIDRTGLFSADRPINAKLAYPVVAAINETFDDLLACSLHTDIFVSSDVVLPARLLAFVKRIPWIHTLVSPVVPSLEFASTVRGKAVAHALKEGTRALGALCKARGIATAAMFCKPQATVGLYSPAIVEPEPSHASEVNAVGFPFYDFGPRDLDSSLDDFLTSDGAPVVFTFGSAATVAMQSLYQTSISVAACLGLRAVLIAGAAFEARSAELVVSDKLFICKYAPYHALFSRACAVVNHGGIGTIAAALRAGRPMVVTPFFIDQPFNAALAQRLGVARVIQPEDYRVETLTEALKAILAEPSFSRSAQQLASIISKENGAAATCDIVERLGPSID